MPFNAFAQYRATAVGLVSLRGQSSAALPSPRTDMTTSSAYRRPPCYHPRSHMITLTVSSIRSFSVTTACNQRRTERDKVHTVKENKFHGYFSAQSCFPTAFYKTDYLSCLVNFRFPGQGGNYFVHPHSTTSSPLECAVH